MTDHDALVRAICANPDDDTPRLVYADYLDENDESERAAFVRAQVELARTPPWEPFAVFCRYRRPEWSEHGEPFRSTLPDLGPAGVWHPSAFRRGLGWHARILSHFAWEEIAPRLFEEVPIGEVHLRIGLTLDDWRRFTAADWVQHLRAIHLEAGSPVEPVRSLCESKNAAGITDLHFHAATSPGLPFLVSDLLKTRLGAGLRGLFFRLGESADAAPELLEALGEDGSQIERLTLALMWLTPDSLRGWCERGGPVGLTALDLDRNYGLGHPGAAVLAAGLELSDSLVSLSLTECNIGDYGIGELAGCEALERLRSLDLSRNRFSFSGLRDFAETEVFARLRCLRLQRAGLDHESVEVLTQAKFWPNLVELDLRDNTLDAAAVRSLVEAPVPPDLTAVLVSKRTIELRQAENLREHFGERLILDGEIRSRPAREAQRLQYGGGEILAATPDRGGCREPRGLSPQAALQSDAGTRRPGARHGPRTPLRRPEAPRHAVALRLPPRTRWRPQELGGAEGAIAQPGRQAARRSGRRPPA